MNDGIGKVVCVGRNYADHARELNNPLPAEPILFIKPGSAVVDILQPLRLPQGMGSCHVETEIALQLGEPLSHAHTGACLPAIAGLGIGLDLTLRDLQSQLKEKGLPWEKAKAFDGSCALSEFIAVPPEVDWANLALTLVLNDKLQQHGNSAQMITPIAELLAYASRFFTLYPGDVVLTGTPAGVTALHSGDTLICRLNDWLDVATRVA